MREDHRCRVVLQCTLDHHPGVDGSAIDGAGEQPLEADDLVLVVEEQGGKMLVLLPGKRQLQEAGGILWAGQVLLAGEILKQDIGGDLDQLIRADIAAHAVQALVVLDVGCFGHRDSRKQKARTRRAWVSEGFWGGCWRISRYPR